MGEAEFNEFFSERFASRWPGLRDALLAQGDSHGYADGLMQPYFMDSASVCAARIFCAAVLCAFPPEEGDAPAQILDACAAPGGKTLVTASMLSGVYPGARILANELSSDRRRRLVDVLNLHLPEAARAMVTVSGFDAAAAGGRKSEHGRFSAILLDAPCSSERHVVADPKALGQWTKARVKNLAQRQWALLSSAFLLLAPGGVLVYATCALSAEENDGPVLRLRKKYGDAVGLSLPEPADEDSAHLAALAEKTGCGIQFLPDACHGAGPLYVSCINKKAAMLDGGR